MLKWTASPSERTVWSATTRRTCRPIKRFRQAFRPSPDLSSAFASCQVATYVAAPVCTGRVEVVAFRLTFAHAKGGRTPVQTQ